MDTAVQFNKAIFTHLAFLLKKEKLAHAYLFIGPNNIGKGETAVSVAKLVNCEQERKAYCDVCPSCIKINSGQHPDVTVIDNGFKEPIKISQIREILEKNRLRAFCGRKKVVIIRNIENLTLESANAFLKTLEEPASDTLIILTTSVPEQNLDTIRSRCHALYFPPISNGALAEQLTKGYSIDERGAHFLAYYTQGCPGTAHRLLKEQFVEEKNALVDTFILNRPDDGQMKGLLADKQSTKDFLDICSSWIRDALLIKVNVDDEALVHLDRQNDLIRFARKFTFEELNEINKSVVNMHKLLADNLNIKLPLLIIGEQLWQK